MEPRIPFSRPYRSASELTNLTAVLHSDHTHGDGPFTASATAKLTAITGAAHVLVTTSCTHALEMAGLLLELGPTDEVILPSFTFPSAATSVALRGATCVFVDIDPTTGNIDPAEVAAAITPRTKAIYVMHYGGVAADMDALLAMSAEHGLSLVEDNAHGLGARWRDRQLGTLGTLGTLSFHDTKNIHCGEGGALLISDAVLLERAEMIREKGTDRARFLRGQVDKYVWQEIGSSYLPSELNAAVLDSQLDEFDTIQAARQRVWDGYARALPEWASANRVQLMSTPVEREHTAHLFYLLAPTPQDRDDLIEHLRARGISAPFHYVPLDSSPAGLKFGRVHSPCTRTADFSARLIRLPLWAGITDSQIDRVVLGVTSFRARG
ncbi:MULTISPECIES: dTDP-4-amino-4,6-dideoxygalactose transaminase [unclassified Rhodococcus (in: high G+C Gram-positive bacteria)]|uniref:dTDP-4-amino-4,6-dideoxygalactose transaminase n=1 Tax=unclassified Rhodococcus (in: high G+C Gram-positive bacteria) TaxID=192944 RepID=UPI0037CAD92F